MSVAFAVWGVRVEPRKKVILNPPADIRITNAALGAELKGQSARSSVKLTYARLRGEEEEASSDTMSTILCSLTPGKIEHASLDLVIPEDGEVEFEVVGENAIYLSGNYISQPGDESDFDYDPEYDSDSELDNSELDEMELDKEQDDSYRFEEVKPDGDEKVEKTEEKSSKKRPRESDAAESGTDGEKKLSKNQLKKLNKKLKAENGKALPNGESKQEVPKKDAGSDQKKQKESKEAKKEGKGSEKKDEKNKSSEVGSQKKGELKETPSGLKIKDEKVGAGKPAKKGDLVSMRYIGKLTDGKTFDSNTGGKPFRFKLGKSEVIKGWDEGIVGMQAGGERLLIVPPKLGYGSQKIKGIPPNSTLRFECKLLAID